MAKRLKGLGSRLYELGRNAAAEGKARLDESERFQRIKRRSAEAIREGSARVGRYIWEDLGLEDVVNAGLRYSERRLLKFLERMKVEGGFGIEGVFDEVNSLLNSYRLLGVPYGCDFSEVKRAYREKMRRCHPDRHAHNSEAERRATLESQALTEAFEILSRHYGKR